MPGTQPIAVEGRYPNSEDSPVLEEALTDAIRSSGFRFAGRPSSRLNILALLSVFPFNACAICTESCHVEGVGLQEIEDSRYRLQKSGELRQDQFLNLFGREPNRASWICRFAMGKSLRDIITIASALLRGMRRSESIPCLDYRELISFLGPIC